MTTLFTAIDERHGGRARPLGRRAVSGLRRGHPVPYALPHRGAEAADALGRRMRGLPGRVEGVRRGRGGAGPALLPPGLQAHPGSRQRSAHGVHSAGPGPSRHGDGARRAHPGPHRHGPAAGDGTAPIRPPNRCTSSPARAPSPWRGEAGKPSRKPPARRGWWTGPTSTRCRSGPRCGGRPMPAWAPTPPSPLNCSANSTSPSATSPRPSGAARAHTYQRITALSIAHAGSMQCRQGHVEQACTTWGEGPGTHGRHAFRPHHAGRAEHAPGPGAFRPPRVRAAVEFDERARLWLAGEHA